MSAIEQIRAGLRAIKARHEAATKSEWHVHAAGNAVAAVGAPEGGIVAWTYHEGNTVFIAHSHQDVPYLVGALETALEALDEYAGSTWPGADTILAQWALNSIAALSSGEGEGKGNV